MLFKGGLTFILDITHSLYFLSLIDAKILQKLYSYYTKYNVFSHKFYHNYCLKGKQR